MIGEKMSAVYIEENRNFFDKAYERGGLPDAVIVKTYFLVLAQEFGLAGKKSETLLDYGCGLGNNTAFYKSQGFDVYGVDVSKVAIEKCQEKMPDIKNHFRTISPEPVGGPLFDADFDIIVANSVLHLLSDTDFNFCLQSLYDQMKPGGVIIATMNGIQNGLYDGSEPFEDGLRKVSIVSGRNKGVRFMKFVSSPEEVEDCFKLFTKVHIGFESNLYRESDLPWFHYIYIGRKE
jgi:SAM-dependent methyltransferase